MSECVREMTLQEKAESIINLINHKDINAEYLYNWQIDAMKDMCEKQIPMKPVLKEYSPSEYANACPSCGKKVLQYWGNQVCCGNCTQRLDWSVEE